MASAFSTKNRQSAMQTVLIRKQFVLLFTKVEESQFKIEVAQLYSKSAKIICWTQNCKLSCDDSVELGTIHRQTMVFAYARNATSFKFCVPEDPPHMLADKGCTTMCAWNSRKTVPAKNAPDAHGLEYHNEVAETCCFTKFRAALTPSGTHSATLVGLIPENYFEKILNFDEMALINVEFASVLIYLVDVNPMVIYTSVSRICAFEHNAG